MKQGCFVRLTRETEACREKNIDSDCNGIVLQAREGSAEVLFLDKFHLGEYAVVTVDGNGLAELEELPKPLVKELQAFMFRADFSEHTALRPPVFRENDLVELISPDGAYVEYGVRVGDIGCVAADYEVEGKLLVDFAEIDEAGAFRGGCFCVKTEHLKKVIRE